MVLIILTGEEVKAMPLVDKNPSIGFGDFLSQAKRKKYHKSVVESDYTEKYIKNLVSALDSQKTKKSTERLTILALLTSENFSIPKKLMSNLKEIIHEFIENEGSKKVKKAVSQFFKDKFDHRLEENPSTKKEKTKKRKKSEEEIELKAKHQKRASNKIPAEDTTESSKQEKDDYEVIYGGFVKPSVPSNCSPDELKKYGSEASQEVVDIIDKLDFSEILTLDSKKSASYSSSSSSSSFSTGNERKLQLKFTKFTNNIRKGPVIKCKFFRL
jgi:hypothetical protein